MYSQESVPNVNEEDVEAVETPEENLLFIPATHKSVSGFIKPIANLGLIFMGVGSLGIISTVLASGIFPQYEEDNFYNLYEPFQLYDSLFILSSTFLLAGSSMAIVGITIQGVGTNEEYEKWKKTQRVFGYTSLGVGLAGIGTGIGLLNIDSGGADYTPYIRGSFLGGIYLIMWGLPSIIIGHVGIL